jgi:uncharacterized protein YllA (UPF0747 family)
MRTHYSGRKYKINNTKIEFSEEILALLENNPEMFSPNVIMRPLYQEVILPNLSYIGGGGNRLLVRIKIFFNAVNITFPILLVRNSVATEKQGKKSKFRVKLE